MPNQQDKATFQTAGYSFEHPGYWSKRIGAYDATISADAPYVVQIMADDGARCVSTSLHDWPTAAEAIAEAASIVNGLPK